MPFTVEENDSLTRTITIEFDQDDIEKKVNRTLRKRQKDVKIQGFRKGKVPMSVMKERYGDMTRQEALRESMDSELEQLLERFPRMVYSGDRSLSATPDGKYRSTFVIEMLPEVEVTDYVGLDISAPAAEVTDEEVENAISGIQEELAVLEPVEGRDTIEAGDVLVVDIRPISKTFDEVDDEILTKKDAYISIEEDPEKRAPLSESLIGCDKSEPITVVHTFEELGFRGIGADESCTLEIRVHSINKKILPERNDDLALDHGRFKTYDELVEYIKNEIKSYKNITRLAILRGEVRDKLLEKYDFAIPPTYLTCLIDDKLREQLSQFNFPDAFNRNLDLETIFPNIEAARASVKSEVEKTIRINHLTEAISKLENISLSQDELTKFVQTKAMYNNIDLGEWIKRLREDRRELEDVTRAALFEKTLDYVAEKANVTDISQEEFEKIKKEQEEEEIEATKKMIAEITGQEEEESEAAPGDESSEPSEEKEHSKEEE